MIAPVPPADEAAVAAFAGLALDLDIPREALPGVYANLVALAEHWRRLEADGPPPTDR